MKSLYAAIGLLLFMTQSVQAQIITGKASLVSAGKAPDVTVTLKAEGTVSLREDQTFTHVLAELGTLNCGKFTGYDPAVTLKVMATLTNNEGKYTVHFKDTALAAGRYTARLSIAYTWIDTDGTKESASSSPSYVTITVP